MLSSLTTTQGFLLTIGVILLLFLTVCACMFVPLKNRKALDQLDQLLQNQGFFTKTQILNTEMSSWAKSLFIFMLKRESSYRYDYKLQNNTTYEYLHDIPKDQQHLAETYFYRNNDE